MKKTYLVVVLFTFLIISCSKEQNEQEIQNLEIINYTFNNQKIVATFIIDEEKDELIPIEDESFLLVDKILNENETLIQYYLDDNNVILLKNDDELDNYLESIGRPLQIAKERLSAASASPYDNFSNLELYYDCCYDKGGTVYWWTNALGSPDPNYPNSRTGCEYWGTNESRLKDLSNVSLWTARRRNYVEGCYGQNTAINNNPNDRLNSVLVRNVFARFYEHENYGGRTIILDARFGSRQAGHRKLRRVRHRGKWGNRISSIKLSF